MSTEAGACASSVCATALATTWNSQRPTRACAVRGGWIVTRQLRLVLAASEGQQPHDLTLDGPPAIGQTGHADSEVLDDLALVADEDDQRRRLAGLDRQLDRQVARGLVAGAAQPEDEPAGGGLDRGPQRALRPWRPPRTGALRRSLPAIAIPGKELVAPRAPVDLVGDLVVAAVRTDRAHALAFSTRRPLYAT